MCVLLFRNLNSGQMVGNINILGIYKRHCPLMLNLYKFDINRLPLVDTLLILVPSIELYNYCGPHTLTYSYNL